MPMLHEHLDFDVIWDGTSAAHYGEALLPPRATTGSPWALVGDRNVADPDRPRDPRCRRGRHQPWPDRWCACGCGTKLSNVPNGPVPSRWARGHATRTPQFQRTLAEARTKKLVARARPQVIVTRNVEGHRVATVVGLRGNNANT